MGKRQACIRVDVEADGEAWVFLGFVPVAALPDCRAAGVGCGFQHILAAQILAACCKKEAAAMDKAEQPGIAVMGGIEPDANFILIAVALDPDRPFHDAGTEKDAGNPPFEHPR